MEFIRKLFKLGKGAKPPTDTFRGSAPVQSQEEQDAVRERMENEMATQRAERESRQPKE